MPGKESDGTGGRALVYSAPRWSSAATVARLAAASTTAARALDAVFDMGVHLHGVGERPLYSGWGFGDFAIRGRLRQNRTYERSKLGFPYQGAARGRIPGPGDGRAGGTHLPDHEFRLRGR